MTVLSKVQRPVAAPALARLLSDSALSRAALSACGMPLALLDATSPTRPLTYVNPAFEGFFGWREADAIGRSLATVLFHGDDAVVQRLLADSGSRWELKAWGRDGAVRHVELTLGNVRSADGGLTHQVVAFSDRSELERLRAELQTLRALATAP
jgi:PAS domain S-box-containing protein